MHHHPHPVSEHCHCIKCKPLERPCDCDGCRNLKNERPAMNTRAMLVAIASLRAEIGEDSHVASKSEVRVKLPAGFIACGWQDGTTYDAAIVGGFRSKAQAREAAPGIVAEIAAKLANAVLCPDVDPPHCNTGVAWLRVKVQP